MISAECHKIVWGQAYVVDIIGSLHIRIEMIVKILMIRTRPHVLSNMFRRPHHELLNYTCSRNVLQKVRS